MNETRLAIPEVFRTLGACFLTGRPFDGNDPLEVVVNSALAWQLWGREDVVGERLMLADAGAMVVGQGNVVAMARAPGAGDAPPEVYTVVGVVDDLRYAGSEDELPPMLYRSWSGTFGGLRYVVRGSTDATLVDVTLMVGRRKLAVAETKQ